MRVTAVSLRTNNRVHYDAPSRRDMLRNADETHGEQFDRVERKLVTGIIPMLWPKAAPAS